VTLYELSYNKDKTVTKTGDGLMVDVFLRWLAVVILVEVMSILIIRKKYGHLVLRLC